MWQSEQLDGLTENLHTKEYAEIQERYLIETETVGQIVDNL